MVVSSTRKTMFWIVSALAGSFLVAGGFAFGFVACLHLNSFASDDLRRQYLQNGDAPALVRARVIVKLKGFQDGYVRRDPKELDSFVHRLFPDNDEILLLGTDAGEWVRGHRAVEEFIGDDWAKWGDFRFAVDDTVVWSSGDVAWVASVGAVNEQGVDRPLRSSAILTRQGNDWLFRQVNFQWDDRTPRAGDLLHASTYLRLFSLVLHRFRSTVHPPQHLSN